MLRNACGLNISDDVQRHGLIFIGLQEKVGYGFNCELLGY